MARNNNRRAAFNAGSPRQPQAAEVLALMKAKMRLSSRRRGEAIDAAAARLATQDVAAT